MFGYPQYPQQYPQYAQYPQPDYLDQLNRLNNSSHHHNKCNSRPTPMSGFGCRGRARRRRI